jgi:hypothetical protein
MLRAGPAADAVKLLDPVRLVLLYAMLAATVGSLVQYTRKAWRLMR